MADDRLVTTTPVFTSFGHFKLQTGFGENLHGMHSAVTTAGYDQLPPSSAITGGEYVVSNGLPPGLLIE